MTSMHKNHVISKYSIHHINIYWEIMSWLFKDLNHILTFWRSNSNSDLTRFGHTQSNIKKWPEVIKLVQIRFFLKKQLIKLQRTSWSFSLCKINRASRFKVKRMPYHFCSKMSQIYFRKTINIISMSLFAPFIMQNCKTIVTANPELWGKM